MTIAHHEGQQAPCDRQGGMTLAIARVKVKLSPSIPILSYCLEPLHP
ncbi:hypothetical protein JJD41_22960 [Oxynema sp. CENA135]|nr:hypothetical protein [Oxynema sp. CENA135]